MRKQIAILIINIILLFSCFANPSASVNEYILENGTTVFLLEDSSNALINVEIQIKAGFSSQTPDSSGFFTLYTNLLKDITPQIPYTSVECNSDSTSFIFTTTTSQLNNQLSTLSEALFNPNFSDDLINEKLSQLKKQVSENAKSMSYLINSAIDSKVFADSPWKHDSGIYPAIFKKTTSEKARTYIKDIQNNWYTPQNCGIFISGNINSERTLSVIRSTFGKYYSSAKTPETNKLNISNAQKRFVIHDEEISKDLTQVVVQYTMLDMEQADLLSMALNNKYSSFKNKTLSIPELNIPGDEYINVAEAHQQNTSRLIFQTLIQPPENKKTKTNSLQQTLSFLEQIQNIGQTLSEQEFYYAKNQAEYNIEKICQNSKTFMENLSDFWVIQPYATYFLTETRQEVFQDSLTTAKLMSRIDYLKETDYFSTMQALNYESPFVFVIINSADFKKNKKEYLSAGFEEISSKNSSWYVQQMYKNQRDIFKPETNPGSFASNTENDFVKKNKQLIQTKTLTNGIQITTKKNNNSTGLSILINLKGGKLNSANDNGFEEVMANILASMIQKEFYNRQYNGQILGAPTISTSCDLYSSRILIECDSFDFDAVCNAIATSLIYGEIAPATADRAVSGRQYKKRLENGSSVSQLYAALINALYPNSDLVNIFETKNEILTDTTYTKILAAYPDLLNASRFSFIICGDFDDEEKIYQSFENNFTLLENKGFNLKPNIPEIKFPKSKNISVKINHTFLTDIPAEKAGPQPAVLVPTTEFLDPVILCIKNPVSSNSNITEVQKSGVIFEAAFNYLETLINQEISSNKRLKEASAQIQFTEDFAYITFTNVSHLAEIDVVYTKAIQRLKKQILNGNQTTLNIIKDHWILTNLQETSSNSGTAILLNQGFEKLPQTPDPFFYLNKFDLIQKATVQDYQNIILSLKETADLKIYSSDSKQ